MEQNLGLDTSGIFGYDTVTLGLTNGGGPTSKHTVVANIADFTYWLGLFGLRPAPTNFTTLVNPQPSFMELLKNQSQIPSLSYGYTAGNQYRRCRTLGSLYLYADLCRLQ